MEREEPPAQEKPQEGESQPVRESQLEALSLVEWGAGVGAGAVVALVVEGEALEDLP